MYKYFSLRLVSIFALCALLGIGTWHYLKSAQEEQIIDFVYARDAQNIFNLFEENWYWLMRGSKEDYGPHYLPYVFKYKSPQANQYQHNKLFIKVLQVKGAFAGFVAYYMKSKTVGQLLYLAIKTTFRGKQYGELLVLYALKEFTKLGATQVQLVTRIDNIPAQRIYRKVGFHEVGRDKDGIMYFVYEKK